MFQLSISVVRESEVEIETNLITVRDSSNIQQTPTSEISQLVNM